MNCLLCVIIASSLSLHVDSLHFYRFNHRNFISCMHMHIKYWVNVTYIFKMTAILLHWPCMVSWHLFGILIFAQMPNELRSMRTYVLFSSVSFLAHLASMPMSLCNHDLSVMCHCHHRWCHCHSHHWCHLCTAVPVRALITETLYLADICTYIPSICTWNIGSMLCIILKWQPF